jgi:hypothetical protein
MLEVTVTHNRLGTVTVQLPAHDQLDRRAAFAARTIAFPGAPCRVSDGHVTWQIGRSHTRRIVESD